MTPAQRSGPFGHVEQLAPTAAHGPMNRPGFGSQEEKRQRQVAWESYGFLLGRILLSAIFIFSGFMKILTWSQTAEHMGAEGMIAVPFFLAMAILLELGGGLSVLLGYKARLGALALIVFLIPATIIFHDFWTFEGMAQQNQMQHFLKNWTIMGGLFLIASGGPGPLSLDRLQARWRTT